MARRVAKPQEMGLALATSNIQAERWYKRVLRINSRCLVCGKSLRHAEKPEVYLAWDRAPLHGSVATVCAEHGKPPLPALDLYLNGPCYEQDHGRKHEAHV